MANDDSESTNVRRNALINMGSMVRQMQMQGDDASTIISSLDEEIVSRMQDNDSSSAIFSAGNAGLKNLSGEVTDAVVRKLQSPSQKERYASSWALSNSNDNYDAMINRLANESSALVGTGLVSGLRKDELTGEQLSRLRKISLSASTPEQVRYEINKLLGY
jgi:hypothetical protein